MDALFLRWFLTKYRGYSIYGSVFKVYLGTAVRGWKYSNGPQTQIHGPLLVRLLTVGIMMMATMLAIDITDENGQTLVCAEDGGWVDFEIDIPDTATQVRLQPRYIDGGGNTYEHDISLRSFFWEYTPPVPDVVRLRGINTVLVDIDIPSGPTLRYSTVPIRVGGQHYESRLRSVPEVEHSIGSLRRPRFLIPKVILTKPGLRGMAQAPHSSSRSCTRPALFELVSLDPRRTI